jgi:hypothetical protein
MLRKEASARHSDFHPPTPLRGNNSELREPPMCITPHRNRAPNEAPCLTFDIEGNLEWNDGRPELVGRGPKRWLRIGKTNVGRDGAWVAAAADARAAH